MSLKQEEVMEKKKNVARSGIRKLDLILIVCILLTGLHILRGAGNQQPEDIPSIAHQVLLSFKSVYLAERGEVTIDWGEGQTSVLEEGDLFPHESISGLDSLSTGNSEVFYYLGFVRENHNTYLRVMVVDHSKEVLLEMRIQV